MQFLKRTAKSNFSLLNLKSKAAVTRCFPKWETRLAGICIGTLSSALTFELSNAT
jgi:hypothetical protein